MNMKMWSEKNEEKQAKASLDNARNHTDASSDEDSDLYGSNRLLG